MVENTSTQQIIRRFIQELPKDQQKLLVARYFAEMNAAQIAETFGIPAGTVRSQLSRARKTLQESILAYSERTGVKLASYSSVPFFALLANADLAPIPLALNAPSLFSTLKETMHGLSDATKALGEKGLSAQGAPYTNPFIDEFAKNTATHTSQTVQTSAAQAAGGTGASAGSTGATATGTGSASAGAKGASAATKIATTTAKTAQAAGTVAKMGIGGKIAAGVVTVAIAGATAGGVYFAGTNGLIPFIRQKRLKLYKEKVQELEPSFSEFYPEANPSSNLYVYNMSSNFKYTLLDMDGDGLEELLIEITLVTSDGSSVRKPVFFFTTNEDASELKSIEQYSPAIYADYHSESGMWHGTLFGTNDGNGIIQFMYQISPSDENRSSLTRYTFSNNQLSEAEKKNVRASIDSYSTVYATYPDAIELDWRDSGDLSLFDEVSNS